MKGESLNEVRVHCGCSTDEFDELEALCEKEAQKLSTTIAFPEGSSKVEVSFWTEDVPELICVGTFSKKRDGSVSYRLDFSESTL